MIAQGWPEQPYKGLNFYAVGDAPLFAGREQDVLRCARILDQGAVRTLLLHGSTGCGKSSFLRAGLIPFLEQDVGGFRFLCRAEAALLLFVCATEESLGQLTASAARIG